MGLFKNIFKKGDKKASPDNQNIESVEESTIIESDDISRMTSIEKEKMLKELREKKIKGAGASVESDPYDDFTPKFSDQDMNLETSDALLTDSELEEIRNDISMNNPTLLYEALGSTDNEARERLKQELRNSKGVIRHLLKTDQHIEYFLDEVVGLGFLESLIKTPGITDIDFDGHKLVVQTNNDKFVYTDKEVTERDVLKIVEKMANGVNKTFNSKEPIIDAVFKDFRLNAVHRDISPDGTTMSLRVSRKQLVLNKNNFGDFAPMYVYDLIYALVYSRNNILISGMPSTGKTELQKLMVSFIPFKHKVIMVEDVQEAHVKELFPEKNIFSWVTSEKVTISDLVEASLRNNPQWVIVSETRGSEANEMLQAVISGSNIITTLHAPDAFSVPSRFVSMITNDFPNKNEAYLRKDILENFDIGIHIKYVDVKVKDEETGGFKNKRIRYANQIVEFHPDDDDGKPQIELLFEQYYLRGTWIRNPQGKLSEKITRKFAEAGLNYTWKGEELAREHDAKHQKEKALAGRKNLEELNSKKGGK